MIPLLRIYSKNNSLVTKRNLTFFAIGVVITSLLFFLLSKFLKISEEKVSNDYYVLTNQITKMNKMVVVEQDFSSLQKTSISHELLGNKISDNQIITYTKTNAQVSYDLNQMRLKVDSVSKELIIEELPIADIRITPSVEIQSMNDSFFNRINEDQIKKVTASAKNNALKQVDENRLLAEGRQQLIKNLNQIFVLAKALDYTIVDKTGQIDTTIL